jgi:hypothetical protein
LKECSVAFDPRHRRVPLLTFGPPGSDGAGVVGEAHKATDLIGQAKQRGAVRRKLDPSVAGAVGTDFDENPEVVRAVVRTDLYGVQTPLPFADGGELQTSLESMESGHRRERSFAGDLWCVVEERVDHLVAGAELQGLVSSLEEAPSHSQAVSPSQGSRQDHQDLVGDRRGANESSDPLLQFQGGVRQIGEDEA